MVRRKKGGGTREEEIQFLGGPFTAAEKADVERRVAEKDVELGRTVINTKKKKSSSSRSSSSQAPTPQAPTAQAPEEEEVIIPREEEPEVIQLDPEDPGSLSPRLFEKKEQMHQLKQIGTAALVGAGIGAAVFFAGSAVAGKVAATAVIPGQAAAATTTGTTFGTAALFANNAKTVGLSTSLISKAGASIAVAGLLVSVIGSYPFAGFIKEEALQTLNFGVETAKNSGDLQGEQEAINEINEVLNPGIWDKILSSIPFLNVHLKLKEFYKAAATKNKLAQESLDRRREIASGERESVFAEQRRVSDEAARERELEARGEDTAFFEQQAEQQRQDKLREQELDSEYFRLIREKRFEEAEELLQSRIG